jgi:hypothetical protein
MSGKRQAWGCTSVIPALKRLRKEDLKFKAILDFIARLCRAPPTPTPPKKELGG